MRRSMSEASEATTPDKPPLRNTGWNRSRLRSSMARAFSVSRMADATCSAAEVKLASRENSTSWLEMPLHRSPRTVRMRPRWSSISCDTTGGAGHTSASSCWNADSLGGTARVQAAGSKTTGERDLGMAHGAARTWGW